MNVKWGTAADTQYKTITILKMHIWIILQQICKKKQILIIKVKWSVETSICIIKKCFYNQRFAKYQFGFELWVYHSFHQKKL